MLAGIDAQSRDSAFERLRETGHCRLECLGMRWRGQKSRRHACRCELGTGDHGQKLRSLQPFDKMPSSSPVRFELKLLMAPCALPMAPETASLICRQTCCCADWIALLIASMERLCIIPARSGMALERSKDDRISPLMHDSGPRKLSFGSVASALISSISRSRAAWAACSTLQFVCA